MKKIKLFSSIFVATVAISAVAPTTVSAVKIDAPGKGVVKFKPASNVDDTITVPETDPVVSIKPPTEGGYVQSNSMAILTPYLDFGEHEIKQEDQTIDVKVMEYTDAKTSKKYFLPPMLVVKDLRGDATGEWKVSATASDFVTTGGKKLNGAKIKLGSAGGYQLFNNNKVTSSGVQSNTDQNVTSIATPGTGDFKLVSPGTELNTSSQFIMSTENGKGGGQTSLVFDTQANYDLVKTTTTTPGATPAQDVTELTPHYTKDSVVSGIQLFVPAAAIRTTQTYTSDLVWTLEDTI